MNPAVTAYILKEELRRCGAIACKHFQWSSLRVHVTYDLRGTSAGVAVMAASLIRFNILLLREQLPENIKQIAAHELAHVVVWKDWYETAIWPDAPPAPHGPEWEFVMVELFGRPADVTHPFNTEHHRRFERGLPRCTGEFSRHRKD